MLNRMIFFRALLTKSGNTTAHVDGEHSDAEREAFLRALKRPVAVKPDYA